MTLGKMIAQKRMEIRDTEMEIDRMSRRMEELKSRCVAERVLPLKKQFCARLRMEIHEKIGALDRMKTDLWGLMQDAEVYGTKFKMEG